MADTSTKLEKTTSFNSKNELEEIEERAQSISQKDHHFVPSPEEKKLVRKLNWTFMPYVCLIVFIQVNSNRKIYNLYQWY